MEQLGSKKILLIGLALFIFNLFFISSLSGQQSKDTGLASWYSRRDPGMTRHTASGEIFDDRKLTCATMKDKFGTRLQVTNLKNGKSVICRVNDRGPHKRLNRRVDLTKTAFRKIADSKHGIVQVSVKKISTSTTKTKKVQDAETRRASS